MQPFTDRRQAGRLRYKSVQPGRPHHKGFTLLELLVVISILAILATAIITSIAHAQNSAKRSMTEGNIKLLQSALARYETDFDDFPPSYGDGLKGAASLYECLMTE